MKTNKYKEVMKRFDEEFPEYDYFCRDASDFKKGEWKNSNDIKKFIQDELGRQKEEYKKAIPKVIKKAFNNVRETWKGGAENKLIIPFKRKEKLAYKRGWNKAIAQFWINQKQT